MDSAGTLYGTTTGGGVTGDGTIFGINSLGSETLSFAFCSQESQDCGSAPIGELLLSANDTLFGTTLERAGSGGVTGVIYSFAAGTYATLANFCSRPTCKTGTGPGGGVIEDTSGNLYGAAGGGGKNGTNGGTVFELTGATLKALYSFCMQANCTDGAHPNGTLLLNGQGALFGTTVDGGAYGGGTIFELP